MFVLTTSTRTPWEKIDISNSGKYAPSRTFVAHMLEMSRLWLPKDVESHRALYTDHNGISIDIVRLDYHRGCSVAYAVQHDKNTSGVRFVVYGIKVDSDYGIGIDLDSITTDTAAQFCPPDVTARYIDR